VSLVREGWPTQRIKLLPAATVTVVGLAITGYVTLRLLSNLPSYLSAYDGTPVIMFHVLGVSFGAVFLLAGVVCLRRRLTAEPMGILVGLLVLSWLVLENFLGTLDTRRTFEIWLVLTVTSGVAAWVCVRLFARVMPTERRPPTRTR